MKTLEERLRDAGERFNHETDPTGSLWVALHDVLAIVAEYHSESTEITGTYPDLVGGSISSAPGTISFGSENLRYHRGIDAGETQIPMRDQVLMWLGYWRDHIPPRAVSALQDICGVPDILVADAPRIYRGEEIKDAPDGLYAFPSMFKPRSVLVWRLDEVEAMMNAEPTAYTWAFGPLPDWLVFDIPTNSPSEGKG